MNAANTITFNTTDQYRELDDLVLIRLLETENLTDLVGNRLPGKTVLVFYCRDHIRLDCVYALELYRPKLALSKPLPGFSILHWKSVKQTISYEYEKDAEEKPRYEAFDGQRLAFIDNRCFVVDDDWEKDQLNGVVSSLLQTYLIFGRPLAYYRCTFFFPVLPDDERKPMPINARLKPYLHPTLKKDKNSGKADQQQREEAEAQAYWYFLPAMRDLLYHCQSANNTSSNLKPVEEIRLSDVQSKNWCLILEYDDKNTTVAESKAQIKDVVLYRYFNNIDLLAVSVEPDGQHLLETEKDINDDDQVKCCSFHSDKNSWWHSLVFGDETVWNTLQSSQLEHWLRYTRFMRLLYPSFKEQDHEKKIGRIRLSRPDMEDIVEFDQQQRINMHIPVHAGQNLSDIIKFFLWQFYQSGSQAESGIVPEDFLNDYREVYDDRMFVNVCYGLSGPGLDAECLSRLFALGLFVDRKEDAWLDGYAYSPAVVKEYLAKQSLHLWDDAGTFSGCSDFSNVALGSGVYFNKILAPVHVRFIYERMLIQALLYKASLHLYSHQVALSTEALRNNNRKPIRQLHKDFIQFTNQYWFHEVTAQMQGKQLFALQQSQLGLHSQYAIIKEELERTDEYLDSEYQTEMQSKANLWAVIAGFVGFYAIWLQLLPYFGVNSLYDSSKSIVSNINNCSLTLIFAPLLVVLVSSFFYYTQHWIRRAFKRLKKRLLSTNN